MFVCISRYFSCCLVLLAVLFAVPNSAEADWALAAEFDAESNLDIYSGAGLGSVGVVVTQEGVRADFGFNQIPTNYNFQAWDGTSWPNSELSDFENSPGALASAEAYIEQASVFDQLPYYMGSSIDGVFTNDLDMAASVSLDFTIEIDVNTLAVIDAYEAYADIDGLTGADGFGFAGIRLFDPTAGLNDPGGINNPFAQQLISQASGGATGQQELSLSAEFDNLAGNEIIFQDLRLEVYTIVFTNAVPEPGSFGAIFVLGGFVLCRRRR